MNQIFSLPVCFTGKHLLMAVGWLVQEPVIHDGNLWSGRQTPKVIQWLLCGVGEVQLQNAELIIDYFF